MVRRKSFPSLKVVYKKQLEGEIGFRQKYQWDQFIPANDALRFLADCESEGEMVSITSILKQIHDANKDESNFIRITQDKCPQVCYKDVKLDDDVTVSLVQINCSKEFEDAKIDEGLQIKMLDWTETNGSKVVIQPSEKTKVFTENKSWKSRLL